jgi:uncharacterized protein YegP (UPF0339 family)
MFEIHKSENEKFYFILKAKNGEPICTSEMYESKQGCYKGIDSVKENAMSSGDAKDCTPEESI